MTENELKKEKRWAILGAMVGFIIMLLGLDLNALDMGCAKYGEFILEDSDRSYEWYWSELSKSCQRRLIW